MATDLEKPDFKKQLRTMVQGAQSLTVAYIGVVNGLFATLKRLGGGDAAAIATAAHMDAGYVLRWCDAAFAFGYIEAEGDVFRLSDMGEGMLPDAPDTLMPLAMTMVSSVHMGVRSAGLMRSGERPGENVMAEVETLLPWFGAMLEGTFARFFEEKICPGVPVFAEINERGGLVVDLGCGNGWYLRALARRCGAVRGHGLDGFAENVAQATRLAGQEGLGGRLHFAQGDAREFELDQPADLIAMNRALHHVWESGVAPFIRRLRDNLRPGGAVAIWEPDWPSDRSVLRKPALRGLALHNLNEHVQGNHLLHADEIADAFAGEGFAPEIYRFNDGIEAMIVARLA
jgi:trans-aconitate methyltransferase